MLQPFKRTRSRTPNPTSTVRTSTRRHRLWPSSMSLQGQMSSKGLRLKAIKKEDLLGVVRKIRNKLKWSYSGVPPLSLYGSCLLLKPVASEQGEAEFTTTRKKRDRSSSLARGTPRIFFFLFLLFFLFFIPGFQLHKWIIFQGFLNKRSRLSCNFSWLRTVWQSWVFCL